MNSTKNVLPNFLKTVLFAAVAATSVSAFAGDHKKEEAIGELKDMKHNKTMLKEDELTTSLTDKAGDVKVDVMDDKKAMKEAAEAVADEAPEG